MHEIRWRSLGWDKSWSILLDRCDCRHGNSKNSRDSCQPGFDICRSGLGIEYDISKNIQ